MIKRISELQIGESGVIVANSLSPVLSCRFSEMGFVKGQKVTLIKKAPLSDPVEVGIMGYRVCIRVSQAKLIKVESCD